VSGTLAQVWSPNASGLWVRPVVTSIAQQGRFTNYGVTQPTTTNTGTLPNVGRTTVSGTQTINASYVTANGGRDGGGKFQVANKTFAGRVILQVANVIFHNCQFNSPPPFYVSSSNGSHKQYMVDCSNSACAGIEFWDCKFEPQHGWPGYGGCLAGHGFKAYRCWFEGGGDGVDPFNSTSSGGVYHLDVELYGCWFNNRDYFYSSTDPSKTDPAHPDGTHNDDIQIEQGGDFVKVVGCVLNGWISNLNSEEGYWPTGNSAVQGNQSVSRGSNYTFDRNWIGGGITAPINGFKATAASGNLGVLNMVITGNRFYMNGMARRLTPIPPFACVGTGCTGNNTRDDWSINLAYLTFDNATMTGNVSIGPKPYFANRIGSTP
jgi:hypothetical protein